MSIEEHFANMKKQEAERAANHKRSVTINQMERVKVCLEEDGVSEETMGDYETLCEIVNRLLEERLP